MTQKEEVLQHLIEKGSITDLEAYGNYAIRRLAAHICILRREGHKITTINTEAVNRFGKKTRFATYKLRETAGNEPGIV